MRYKPLLILLLIPALFGLANMAHSAGLLPGGVATETELVINGDMESNEGWEFPVTAVQGGYSTDLFVSPTHSARLGIVTGENRYAFSSMNQEINVPALPAGGSLRLSWRAYLLSQPLDTNDLQYVQIRDANGALHTIWSDERHEAPNWLQCSHDISAYAGQNITLYFGVKNDGADGLTAMYVDDVSLLLSSTQLDALRDCDPLTNTPTPTPTPTLSPTVTPTPTNTPMSTATPTPTPSGPPCQQLIQNPEFDDGYNGWTQNLYLTASYRDETGEEHEGAWFGGAEFVDQYLYQDVTIPADSPAAQLSFLWAFDPADGIGEGDALTITLRDLDDSILATLLTIDENSAPRRWQTAAFDLSPYIGQTVRFHAQAATNATVTSWYLDRIQLYTCQPQEYTTYLPWVMK